jgi:RHS repeat-associated protein
LTTDALGSPRAITDSLLRVKSRRDFLPFGEELFAGIGNRNTNQKYSTNGDDTRKKFATYQRDAETNLDYAQSRYYSPMQGRFTSPDEFKGGPDELFDFEEDASDNPTFYADLENPQSLNKYQYGYNNPYKYNDPTGHCIPCVVIAAAAIIISARTVNAPGPNDKTYPDEGPGVVIEGVVTLMPFGRAGTVARMVRGASGRTVVNQGVKQTVTQTTKQTVKQTLKGSRNPIKSYLKGKESA